LIAKAIKKEATFETVSRKTFYRTPAFTVHGDKYEDLRRYEIALMMEAVSNTETSANLYQTTQSNIPDHGHRHDSGWLEICFPVTKMNAQNFNVNNMPEL
jgi:hypothetical protein